MGADSAQVGVLKGQSRTTGQGCDGWEFCSGGLHRKGSGRELGLGRPQARTCRWTALVSGLSSPGHKFGET